MNLSVRTSGLTRFICRLEAGRVDGEETEGR